MNGAKQQYTSDEGDQVQKLVQILMPDHQMMFLTLNYSNYKIDRKRLATHSGTEYIMR